MKDIFHSYSTTKKLNFGAKTVCLATFLFLLVIAASAYAIDINRIQCPSTAELGKAFNITGEFSYDSPDPTFWAVELFDAKDMPIGPDDRELASLDMETPAGIGTQTFSLSATAPSSEMRWGLVVTLWTPLWNEEISDYEWILTDEKTCSVDVVAVGAPLVISPPPAAGGAEGPVFPPWVIVGIILTILGLFGISLVRFKLVLPKKPPGKITQKEIEDAVNKLEDWNSDKKDGEKWIWQMADEATEKEMSKLSKWDKTISGSLTGATPWMLRTLRKLALSKNRFGFGGAKDNIKDTFSSDPHVRGDLKDSTIDRWKPKEFRENPLDPASHSRAKTMEKFKGWVNSLARREKAGGIVARSTVIDRIQRRHDAVKGKKKLVNKTHEKIKSLLKKLNPKISDAKQKAQDAKRLARRAAHKAKEAKKYSKAGLHKTAKEILKEGKDIKEMSKKRAKEAKKLRAEVYNELRNAMRKNLQRSINEIDKIRDYIKTGKLK